MASPRLRIRLLGGFDLRQGEVALPPLGSARAESLLALLLLHQESAQPRQHLAFLLWPDSGEAQARTNLRHLLHVLRRALPEADRFLEVTPRTLRWRADAPCWLDVAAFDAAVARSEREPGGSEAALAEAVELYAGDLLQGSYDEWLAEERERLRQRYLQALERLVELQEARGDLAAAARHAERLLREDPLREPTYQVLMRLHDARGDRARALRVYHACSATLARELGVEPSAATRRAYAALLPSQPEPTPDQASPLRAAGAAPLIGRAAQRALLVDLWRASERGAAQLALVTGEPGAGKTRLVEELAAWCAQSGAATAEARSYPAEGALAYGPVVAWLRSDPIAAHLGRLHPRQRAELARLLPELAPPAAGPPPEPPPDRGQRRLLFEALAQAVAAPGGPLLLVADDLHWADAETVAFLHFLLRSRPQARLLVAATARDEHLGGQHPLRDLRTGLRALGLLTEVEVGRLSPPETASLAGRLAGHELAPAEAERLFAETEGNPLFVVEALRAGWLDRPGERGPITPRVQAVIEARLAQLSPAARELVGVAAAIGRELTTDVLAQASQTGEEALVGALDELWRRRIVRDRGPDAYDFTHDRIREVAYLALGPARRRHIHGRVARALERLHAGDPDPVAAQVAAHHDRAGEAEAAIAWYERGAAVAQRLGANAEAVRLLERAVELVRAQPRARARQERELALVTRLQAPLGVAQGYASDRLAEAQRRGLELAGGLGVEPDAPLLLSIAVARLVQGDFEGAQRVGERLRAGGIDAGDDVRRVEGEYVLGIASFWKGEFAAARRRFEAAVDHYRPEQRPTHLLRFGIDLEVVCASRLGNTLWFLGHPDAAARAAAALTLATEVGHPFSRATALVFAAMLAVDLGDPASVRAHTAALFDQPDHEPPIRVPADALRGFVEVLDGRAAAGIDRVRRALDDPAEGEHAPGMHASVARVLLEACRVAGDAKAGLAAADRVLAATDNVRTWEAEARRLRGEFLAALGAPADQVTAELEGAVRTARRQGARMLELRASDSLRRHRRGGDPAAAGTLPGTLAERPAGDPPPSRPKEDR